ncbi:DUF3311 domain-containing protein [Halobacillus shinanisalinarum]|uniref:DUF3311 domain-containing protein n=1 Tax=Halobacillus shinanisalinarum TaxID=2932258 RepID=A0ABY4GV05_9BACI|nr:DUF3311 domain-containing protein [Halobacillus shinanisalinarum]UOQ91854.1 DUF3311 domain-containing protein [Halobacillus shinanisalinarum]
MSKKVWLYMFSMVPAIGSLVVINKTEPYVFGMPFVLFWLMAWVVLTSVFLYLVNILDPANKEEEEI